MHLTHALSLLVRRGLAALVVLSCVSAAAHAEAAHIISQKSKQFAPGAVTIKVGESIEFKNDDNVVHNVYTKSDKFQFSIRRQVPGDSKSVKFTAPGVYEIRCAIHPTMRMTVTVTP
jgi:plastocyanin